jgi:hypothetical protein
MLHAMDPDRAAIREVVENWALWRDAGDWERFATVWHADGHMSATWFQGPAADFIAASREGFERGVSILHFLGGTTVDVRGERAIAQTKMTILQRAAIDGVEVDVGYRHLGYVQTKLGFDVRLGLPGLTGEAVGALYAEGREWLG